MKKKLISYILIGVLAISLTACTGKIDSPKENETTQEGNTEDNSSEEKKEVSLDVIHTAVKDAYGEDYIPNMALDSAMLEEKFGIKEDWYTDMVAEEPMISGNVDTFIAIEAKEENVSEVETALNAYREKLVNDTLQYPMNLPKINASQVVTMGNNVYFIMLGVISDDMDKTEEELLKAAGEQNNIAIEAIKQAME